eukprot:12290065-Alexandrium_andersonii.AAC.1
MPASRSTHSSQGIGSAETYRTVDPYARPASSAGRTDTTSEWVAAPAWDAPAAKDERWASWPGTTPAGSRAGERQVASGTT